GAVDHQAGPFGGSADLLAQAQMAPAAGSGFGLTLDTDSHGLLTCLSGLAAELFAFVAHALALVRVRSAQLADVRGNLTDLLLVNAGDGDLIGTLYSKADALGGFNRHRVGVPQRDLKVIALGQDAVAGADHLQLLREA